MKIIDRQLGFASELVPLIQNGTKTLTYRVGDKWNFLNAGDEIETKDSSIGKVFARLEILQKEQTTFGELSNTREGHEKYENKEDRVASFRKHYQRDIEDSEPVTILQFKVVELIS